MTVIKPLKKARALVEASPYKSLAEELETFRRTFREVCRSYAERLETEIDRLHERVVAAAGEQDNSGRGKQAGALEKLHDLRDMLTLLRTMQVRPAEGRRKDLKKFEAVLEELRLLSKGWA